MPTADELHLLEYINLKNRYITKKKGLKKLISREESKRLLAQHQLDIDKYEKKFRHILFNKITTRDSEMVIAHYSEDLSWALEYRKWIIVFHKGGDCAVKEKTNDKKNRVDQTHFRWQPLPNIGREGHTFLYYIVNRWNSLPENIFFTQGNCSSDHRPFPVESYLIPKPNITLYMNVWNRGIEFTDGPGGEIKHVGKWKKEKENGDMSPSSLSFLEWWYEYISPVLPIDGSLEVVFKKWKWSHGAIFSVSRKSITSHPLLFYQRLLTNLQRHINPEEGHFLEKSWFYIFDRDSQKKMRIIAKQE